MTLYSSPFVLVEDFMLKFGQTVRVTPHADIPERNLRIELIREELQELIAAAKENDFIEVVDAIADILYVTYGAAVAHGINIDYVMGSFENKSPAINVNRTLDAEGTPLPSTPRLSSLALAREINSLTSAFKDYVTASDNLDTKGLTNAISKIIFSSYALAKRLGVDIDDVLDEVQRSNLSKLGLDGKPIFREDNKVLKGPNFFVPDIQAVLLKQGWEN